MFCKSLQKGFNEIKAKYKENILECIFHPEAVEFMWDCLIESVERMKDGYEGSGCILAHCMGLGKTLSVSITSFVFLKSKDFQNKANIMFMILFHQCCPLVRKMWKQHISFHFFSKLGGFYVQLMSKLRNDF